MIKVNHSNVIRKHAILNLIFLFISYSFIIQSCGKADTPKEAKTDNDNPFKAELQNKKLSEAELLDLSKKITKGDIIRSYVFPKPSALCKVLNDNGFDYKMPINNKKTLNLENDFDKSLQLGIGGAYGIFLLNLNKDNNALKNTFQEVKHLADDLFISDSLKREIKITKAALKAENYDAITSNLDDIFGKIEITFRKLDRPELSALVSLGGWLEGMYHITSGLQQHYNDSIVGILAQHTILDSYIKVLETNFRNDLEKDKLINIIHNELKTNIKTSISQLSDTLATKDKKLESIASLNKSASLIKKAIISKNI